MVVEPLKEDPMFLTFAVVLAVVWALGLFAFHVAGGLIHLLLIVGLISLVVHFVRGRRTTTAWH
jgi:Family of unknown function (DUF5670)